MPHVSDSPGDDIWGTLLKSVAAKSARSMPRRTLLVLGGTPSDTKEFVQNLRQACTGTKEQKPGRQLKEKIPSNCSDVATYTYIDIEDSEVAETIGRLGLYMLPGCDDTQSSGLLDFLTTQRMNELTACVLLDWHKPWTWLRTIRYWVRSMASIMESLKESSSSLNDDVDKCIKEQELKIRSYTEASRSDGLAALQKDPSLARPLEKGEFDRPLGVPLLCVANSAEYTHVLDREYGMREEQFDFIQQVIRTILLRHGGSTIYTSLGEPDSMRLLNRHLKREILANEDSYYSNEKADLACTVIRDQVYVPAGWDSFGKISVLRDGFEVEKISQLWTSDLDRAEKDLDIAKDTAVDLYEEIIANPARNSQVASRKPNELEVVAVDRMKILQELEQRQWEVQEDGHDAEEIADTDSELFERPRSRPLQSMGLRDSAGSSSTHHSVKNGTNKDEYVQAFFQNLLNRRETERA